MTAIKLQYCLNARETINVRACLLHIRAMLGTYKLVPDSPACSKFSKRLNITLRCKQETTRRMQAVKEVFAI